MIQLLEQFARDLEAKQRATRLADKSSVWRPHFTPVTDLGYRCDRRVVYHRTQPEMAAPINEELASIFTEGRLHEKDIRQELSALGYEVVGAEVNFRDEALEISGTIDGEIEMPVTEEQAEELRAKGCEIRHGKWRIPVECKSVSGNGPQTEEDWCNHSSPMFRRWHAQLSGYLYLKAQPYGLGLFKSKLTGLWNVCPAELGFGYVETLLQRAERVRDAVAAVKGGDESGMPDRILDRSECGSCPWRDTVCHPADAEIDPLLLVTDERLVGQLKERHELDPQRKRFKKLDDEIKNRFKATKGDQWVAGTADDGFCITRKVSKNGAQRFNFQRLEATAPEPGEE